MSDSQWYSRETAAADQGLGAEMRRLFDAEKEDLPPLFFETLQLSRGIAEEIAWHEELEEQVLRGFFQRIGRDYDAWRRAKQRQRHRRWLAALSASLLLVVLVIGLFSQPQILEAVRRPLVQWFRTPPTPVTAQQVTRYQRIADIQPYFSVTLPQALPAGFRLVNVVLEQGFPAGPRAVIFYQHGDPSDPDDPGVEVHLIVWSLQDEPFPLPLEVAPEEVELDGLPASWVAWAGGGPGQVWQPEGGYLLWERAGWKFALVSGRLSRDELVKIGTELVRQ